MAVLQTVFTRVNHGLHPKGTASKLPQGSQAKGQYFVTMVGLFVMNDGAAWI